MPNDEIRATATGTGRRIKIKPEKGFLRLDKPFNDAVRAKKKSAVTNVLLRKELSGELAQRTATEILSTVRRERTLRREAIVRGSELCDGGRLSV
jgi:hypothetical protein